MTVIRAAHYSETEERLTQDPIVQAMAVDLFVGGIRPEAIAWDDGKGSVRHEWSLRLNARYREQGGTDGGHIGAVPTAVLTVLHRVLDAVAEGDAIMARRAEKRDADAPTD